MDLLASRVPRPITTVRVLLAVLLSAGVSAGCGANSRAPLGGGLSAGDSSYNRDESPLRVVYARTDAGLSGQISEDGRQSDTTADGIVVADVQVDELLAGSDEGYELEVIGLQRVPIGLEPADDDEEPDVWASRTVERVPAEGQESSVDRVLSYVAGEMNDDSEAADSVEVCDEVWALPIESPRVTSQFGARRDPMHGRRRIHRGTDFGAPSGTPIFATASGRVVMGGWCDRGTGNCVVIDHPFSWRSQYFHMSETVVSPHDRVEQGQLIGYVGSTGRSTGPHLHFQIGPVGGQAVDPLELIGEFLDGRAEATGDE